jgi:3-hydroxyisobutyrate dehydrogenase
MATTERRPDDSEVAVLGTGIIGSAMARNLVRAGLRTAEWDRGRSATAALANAGACLAASPNEAVQNARVVITMLPTAEAVSSIMFDGGVAASLAKGAVGAQMGTIGVTATEEIAARLAQMRHDVLLVDAPVSGSKGPATSGQLLILASGPREATPIVQPAFSAIGRKTVWLGEAGQGSRMKLVVNAYMSILIEGVAEALELAGRLGIDPDKLAEAIEGGPLDAPIAEGKLHKMEQDDFTAEFPMQWALKDVDLALEEAGADPPPLLAALSPQVARGRRRGTWSRGRQCRAPRAAEATWLASAKPTRCTPPLRSARRRSTAYPSVGYCPSRRISSSTTSWHSTETRASTWRRSVRRGSSRRCTT